MKFTEEVIKTSAAALYCRVALQRWECGWTTPSGNIQSMQFPCHWGLTIQKYIWSLLLVQAISVQCDRKYGLPVNQDPAPDRSLEVRPTARLNERRPRCKGLCGSVCQHHFLISKLNTFFWYSKHRRDKFIRISHHFWYEVSLLFCI